MRCPGAAGCVCPYRFRVSYGVGYGARLQSSEFAAGTVAGFVWLGLALKSVP